MIRPRRTLGFTAAALILTLLGSGIYARIGRGSAEEAGDTASRRL